MRAEVVNLDRHLASALLGVVLLGDPFTAFTALGGALIVAGLTLTART